jgi:hypothetical protein
MSRPATNSIAKAISPLTLQADLPPSRRWCHNYGVSVRTTIDIPDDLYATLRLRAAAERTSIRALVTDALYSKVQPKKSNPVTGPLVGKKRDQPAPGSPDTENPYDVLFA